jgi:hypothetical protein
MSASQRFGIRRIESFVNNEPRSRGRGSWIKFDHLEHFQAKWKPVRRPEMRQNKKTVRFHDSPLIESALE